MVKTIAKCRKPIKYYIYTAESGNIYMLKLEGEKALDGYHYKIVNSSRLLTKEKILDNSDGWWGLNGHFKEITKEEFLLGKI
jgi:hypothetical protein